MKKIIKIVLFFLLAIIIVLISLPFLFKKQILTEVTNQINKNINAKVALEDLNLGIFKSFPNLNLELINLSVQNGEEFDSLVLLKVKKIQVNLDLMSVIKGEHYMINKILIQEPDINAMVNKLGKSNWDIVKHKDTTQKEQDTTTTTTKFQLALKQFSIEKANIVFEDKKGGSYYETKNLNYQLNGNLSNDFTTILNTLTIDETSAQFQKVKYLSKAKINFEIEIDADLKNQKYTFKQNTFKINDLELVVDGWVKTIKENIDMDIQFKMPKITFKSLLSLVPVVYSKDFSEIKANGLVSFNGWLKGIKTSSTLPKFSFNLDVEKADIQYPKLPKKVDHIELQMQVKNNYGNIDSTVVNLQKLHVEMGANSLQASLILNQPVSDPNLDAKVSANIDLKTLKDFVPVPEESKLDGHIETQIALIGKKSMIDKKQYDKFKANGVFQINNVQYVTTAIKEPVLIKNIALGFSTKNITLKNFEAKVGESDLNANGSIDNFLEYIFKKDSTLIGTFNFNSSYINSKSFLSTDTTQKVETAKSEPMKVIEIPSNINFILKTNIKKLKHDKIEVNNINGQVQVKDQKLLLNGLSIDLLEGNIKLNGVYNTQNIKKPHVDLGLAITKLDIQKTGTTFNTVNSIAPYIKECFGKFSCNISFFTVLSDTMSPIMNTLYSKGKIQTSQLILKGENTEKLAELLKNKNLKEIQVSDLQIQYELKDGKLILDTNSFMASNIQGKYAATYSLDKNVDAVVKTVVPFEMFKEQVITADVENLLLQAKNNDIPIALPQTLMINVSIKGKAPKLEYGVSLDKSFLVNLKNDIMKGISNKLNKEKERLLNEAKKKVEEEKEKALKEVNKRANEEKNKLLDKGKDELKKLIPKW